MVKSFSGPAQGDSRSRHVGRMMLCLLLIEWIGMILTAAWLSPFTWTGVSHGLHPHLIWAILSGPVFIVPIALFELAYPGSVPARHAIAVAQMLISLLLIDITGGRIETHFHIFGSLAFLAFYRDWRVLVTASAVTAFSHLCAGIWWPQVVYGTLTSSPWLWVEHTWWVVFEDIFLFIGISRELRTDWVAHHDSLTGLANRRQLQESFERQTLTEQPRLALLFIDLDRFKQANDTLGHSTGDRLLAMAGHQLAAAAGEGSLVARIGGDEFVALVSRSEDDDTAVATGDRLLAALRTPFQVFDNEIILSGSVGIALCPEHGTDLRALLGRADAAMYVAKRQGRNHAVVFSPEVVERDNLLRHADRDIHQALKNGEFHLNFQPVVGITHHSLSFEALLRWVHPDHGSISLAEFIPLAESSGLIVGIGDWVLREACLNCQMWQSIHPGTSVAVNVSVVQFEVPGFAESVFAALRETGLDPHLLILELTESCTLKHAGAARERLAAFRAAGIRIALDDFGTGYSSLSYLTSLPVDAIKLDKSFLAHESSSDTSVIAHIVEIAHRLDLKVVVEGIETAAQAERLRSLDCDMLQGFYFGRPAGQEATIEFLEKRRIDSLLALSTSALPPSASASNQAPGSEHIARTAPDQRMPDSPAHLAM
jgi:diguanylate cyclase (GGDEF)-like protein